MPTDLARYHNLDVMAGLLNRITGVAGASLVPMRKNGHVNAIALVLPVFQDMNINFVFRGLSR